MPSSLSRPASVFILLLLVSHGMAQEKTPPKKNGKDAVDKTKILAQPIPGYQHRVIYGFDLLVNDEVFEHNDDAYVRKPLQTLELELATIVRVLPPRAVNVLRQIVTWVEWDDVKDPDHGIAVAKFYGVLGDRVIFALNNQKHPLKANNVEIISMKQLTEEHQPDVKLERCVLLHELAHAVHHHVFSFDNPHIRAAYGQAMERKLYETSKDVYGRTIEPYAATNEAEYFAELSCAYLDKLHYFPNNASDLKEHDPVGHRMMELTWGTKQEIEAANKAEAEKLAIGALTAAKKLRVAGKKDEYRDSLALLIESFPATKAAAEAKSLLKSAGVSTKKKGSTETAERPSFGEGDPRDAKLPDKSTVEREVKPAGPVKATTPGKILKVN